MSKKSLICPSCKKLIDFSTSNELGLDTGGLLFMVLERYGNESAVFFNEVHVQNPYFNKSMYNFYAMINNGMFLHCINGSNWNPSESHEERTNSLLNIIEEKINE